MDDTRFPRTAVPLTCSLSDWANLQWDVDSIREWYGVSLFSRIPCYITLEFVL